MPGSIIVSCTEGKNTIDNNLAEKGMCVRMKHATVHNQEQFQDSVSKRVYYSKNFAIIAFMVGTATSVC